MGQFQNVPGPSQADFNTLSEHIDPMMKAFATLSNNNTHSYLNAGDFVYVYNHGTLSEGLYVAKTAISANGTLSSSNLDTLYYGGLNKVNDKIANLITTERYTITISESVGAGVSKSYSKSVAKSGYTPIGIIQLYGSGTGSFAFQDHYITGTDAMIYVRNVTSSAATLINIQFVVLYMKS